MRQPIACCQPSFGTATGATVVCRSVRTRYALAGFWTFAGIMHFVIPRTYGAIVPPQLKRWRREVVYASGVAELAGGLAVLPERHPARRALVADCHAGRRLPRELVHGGGGRPLQGHPRARALGAAAAPGRVRLVHLARHALAPWPGRCS